jgi:hypothetical protein
MSDFFQSNPIDGPPPKTFCLYPELPAWLARRLLRADEQITWVRGPWWNPWWERYVTHPALFLLALALGAACLWAGRLSAQSWSKMPPLPAVAAAAIVLGAIFVIGISAGYFTRLVVTNCRVVILQGYEVYRSWSLDDLPLSLIRYARRRGEEASRTVDLDALQTLLGSASEQFAGSKTILSFGKQLDRIKAREDGRP